MADSTAPPIPDELDIFPPWVLRAGDFYQEHRVTFLVAFVSIWAFMFYRQSIRPSVYEPGFKSTDEKNDGAAQGVHVNTEKSAEKQVEKEEVQKEDEAPAAKKAKGQKKFSGRGKVTKKAKVTSSSDEESTPAPTTVSSTPANSTPATTDNDSTPSGPRVRIFFSTMTGQTEKHATALHQHLISLLPPGNRPTLQNLDYLPDLDELFTSPDGPSTYYIFLLPSYAIESPIEFLLSTMEETYNDFRVGAKPLRGLGGFAVFGTGDKEGWGGDDEFCYQALQVDRWLGKLGGKRVFPVGMGDVKTDAKERIEEWAGGVADALLDPEQNYVEDASDESDAEAEVEDEEAEANKLVDVEDMGAIMKRSRDAALSAAPKEMVSKASPTYAALTKQGYKIVGSHSGVKICRWTKSALRGRGSCYKFSFYGIKSHLCMETTPSLACANKCVFCWRHGTNPVGTTWRWKVDPPEQVLEGALEGHYSKIKMMKGVPGVRADRFQEAFRVRHCALSLVGEPIFYPHINEFLEMLHAKRISSFLVTNAQHPDALAKLGQVTQLYVSIDASTKDSLRKVDRPLFKDFWERFLECLEILADKGQRTVYRLTLVKGFNIEEVEEYVDIVRRGRPCFIEVKGVTYCGSSEDSTLTMSNVPFYHEVVDFVTQLTTRLAAEGLSMPTYEIAAEHAHSCSVLIGQTKFKINDQWHTHINYDRFFELLESGKPFDVMDYIAPTPEWAVFGNGGFNPEDVRVDRKGRPKVEKVVPQAKVVEVPIVA
ncbi:Fe-S oxidoreductase [Saitoella coloradoensis]